MLILVRLVSASPAIKSSRFCATYRPAWDMLTDEVYLTNEQRKKAVVANSNERLQSVLARLEECRAALVDGGNRETALLVSVAILDLRMKLHEIADSELKALCEAIAPDGVLERRSADSKPPQSQRLPPVLKLVK